MKFIIQNSQFIIFFGGIEVAIPEGESDMEVTMSRTIARVVLLPALMIVFAAADVEAQWMRGY